MPARNHGGPEDDATPPPAPAPSLGCTASDLAPRLAILRTDLYGTAGVGAIARSMGLPAGTWANYEAGVTIPGAILLQLLVLTSAEPRWLLAGLGPRYRTPAEDVSSSRDARRVSAADPHRLPPGERADRDKGPNDERR